jgi:regulator of sirC expression with transglutaminase-like and TPR domain
MGQIYKDTRRSKEAIEAFERHLKINPDDLDAELVKEEIQTLRRR